MRDIQPRKITCYCMNFRRMANALTKFYDSMLAAVNLTANQLSLLADIQSIEPCNRSELARCARLDRTTVIRNLEVLRKKGLIEETEGRNAAIKLTEQGQNSMEEGFVLWKEAQARIKEVFDPESRAVLRNTFEKIEQIEILARE